MRKKLIGIFVLGVCALLLQACGRETKPEEACNFVQNNKAQRVSWGDATPVTLYIHSSFPDEHLPALETAVEEWNKARGRLLIKVGGRTNSTAGPARDGASIVYWLQTWEADRPFEQARTTVYWTGSRIFEADVRINAKNFRFVNGKEPGRVDLVSLLVHEFGHVLGLAHVVGPNDPSSVMAKSLANNTERRQPTVSDIDSLKCEY